MTPDTSTVLVTGATGQQGGATALRLLAEGRQVRALVCHPSKPAAQELARRGARLVRGDMDDRRSLDAAMQGAHGVFSVQPALIPPDFAENELRRGVNVAEAAHDAGVRHLVHASVAGADRDPNVPHWKTKWSIEQHIRRLDVPATVLRPVLFMENFADPTYGLTGEHSLARSIPHQVTVQPVALRDIGAFAAMAFGDPERYIGTAIELAGDERSVDRILAGIGRAVGRVPGQRHSPEESGTRTAAGDESGYTSFAGWQADIPALRERYPDLMDFDTWLEREGTASITALLGRA